MPPATKAAPSCCGTRWCTMLYYCAHSQRTAPQPRCTHTPSIVQSPELPTLPQPSPLPNSPPTSLPADCHLILLKHASTRSGAKIRCKDLRRKTIPSGVSTLRFCEWNGYRVRRQLCGSGGMCARTRSFKYGLSSAQITRITSDYGDWEAAPAGLARRPGSPRA